MSEAPARPLIRRAIKPLLALVVIALLVAITQRVRSELGIEWSQESIQATVKRLGVWAPLGFLALVMVRQFMALPSILVLTTAGLLFGAPLGTLLGGIGMTLNAIVLFTTARMMGRDWVLPRLQARWPDFEERAKSTGPLVIAFMTGHPMGALTPFHFAAGITRISFPIFLVAVLPAALFRAACYSFLGANLMEPSSPRFWVATGLLLLVSVLPLAHPGLRARLLRRPQSDSPAVD